MPPEGQLWPSVNKQIVAGVWGWAGVVLAAGAEVPEADWATFMNEVASVWVKYAYPDGSLVLPRYK